MIKAGSIVTNHGKITVLFEQGRCDMRLKCTIESGDQWLILEKYGHYGDYIVAHMDGRKAYMSGSFLSSHFKESEHNDD